MATAKKAAPKKAAAKKAVVTAPAETTKPAEQTFPTRAERPVTPQPQSMTGIAPATITDRLVRDALEAGLPERDESCESAEYHAMYDTYVRFIRQSPEKFAKEKKALLAKLEASKNVEEVTE